MRVVGLLFGHIKCTFRGRKMMASSRRSPKQQGHVEQAYGACYSFLQLPVTSRVPDGMFLSWNRAKTLRGFKLLNQVIIKFKSVSLEIPKCFSLRALSHVETIHDCIALTFINCDLLSLELFSYVSSNLTFFLQSVVELMKALPEDSLHS